MKIVDILCGVLLITLIMPLIATMVPIGPVHFMTVTGSSMEPTITSSDIIVVKTADVENLAIGDIISYRHQFEESSFPVVITHRIVGIVNGGYRTKGDAYSTADEYIVMPENIVGILKFKIPLLGRLAHFASTSMGFLTLVIIPAVIIIMGEVREIMTTKR